MRLNFKVTMVGCALAAAISASSSAMADWHTPNFYRQTNGTWTNIHYDDGICNYYYSHNSYDNQTNLNKYGDWPGTALAADGSPIPIAVGAVPYPGRQTVGRGGLKY